MTPTCFLAPKCKMCQNCQEVLTKPSQPCIKHVDLPRYQSSKATEHAHNQDLFMMKKLGASIEAKCFGKYNVFELNG